jgi:hypothetical protein
MGWREGYARHAARIDADVAAAPNLSAEQLARLAVLLNTTTTTPTKSAAPDLQIEGSESDPTLAKVNQRAQRIAG